MNLNIVSAGHGAKWVRQGLRTFMKHPLGLTGLFLMFALLLMGLHVLPTLGTAVGLMLVPAFTSGFVRATAVADQGKFPLPHVLVMHWVSVPALRLRMLTLGAWYLLSIVLVMLASAFADGGTLAQFYLLGGKLVEEDFKNPALVNAALLCLVLYLPVSMAFWHAPMLVADANITPVKALFFSFMACKRNLGAFTLYGLSWALFYLALSMVVSIIGVLLGGPDVLQLLVFPLTLGMATLFFTSIHYSYQDCFTHPQGDTRDAP